MLDPNFKITEVVPSGYPVNILEYNPGEKPTLTSSPLPDWLSAAPSLQEQYRDAMLPKYPRTKERIELEEAVFDIFFERFLDGLVEGEMEMDIIRQDPRGITMGRFMRWIMKDTERNKRYEEAKMIQTIFMENKRHKIAEGLDNPMEDITRSKLRSDTIKDSMTSWNRKRFGTEKEQVTPFGTGGIVINIGSVESPYQNVIIDQTPTKSIEKC